MDYKVSVLDGNDKRINFLKSHLDKVTEKFNNLPSYERYLSDTEYLYTKILKNIGYKVVLENEAVDKGVCTISRIYEHPELPKISIVSTVVVIMEDEEDQKVTTFSHSSVHITSPQDNNYYYSIAEVEKYLQIR